MGRGRKNSHQTRNLRRRVRRRDGDDCLYCGGYVSQEDESLEHRQELSSGGTYELPNLALAHRECNNQRSNSRRASARRRRSRRAKT